MDYKKLIIEMVERIESEKILRYLYIIIRDVFEEVQNGK